MVDSNDRGKRNQKEIHDNKVAITSEHTWHVIKEYLLKNYWNQQEESWSLYCHDFKALSGTLTKQLYMHPPIKYMYIFHDRMPVCRT